MSLHPSIQVGSEVAIRDLRAPWAFLGGRLWRLLRVERISRGRRVVETSDTRRWHLGDLAAFQPLTDEIMADIVHENLLRNLWARMARLTSLSGEGPRWPERVTPEQARRVEELLTEIEMLIGFRAPGGGQ